ncbi:MAG: GNAT family N-acetyltransferase [Ruminococcaceae bacterium]|nr:GNAT family N-acetyltransferase [Oscillospiraceae bacterium]
MINFEICPMVSDSEMDEKGFVHWKSWQETYTQLMPDDYLKNLTLEKCVEMAHKFPQNTLLLKVDGKTVGFSCILKRDDVTEIVAIYLLKAYHGKKLGYELLKHTISAYCDNTKVVLWVLEGNDRAISFYKRFGFEYNGLEKQLPFGKELQMEYINND